MLTRGHASFAAAYLSQFDLKTWIAIFVLLFGSGVLLKLGSKFRRKPKSEPSLPPNTYLAEGGQFSGRVRFAVGDYVEILRPPNAPIRISAREIIKYVPERNSERDAVVLDFSTGGGLVHGGPKTKKVDVNCYALIPCEYSREEEVAAYLFRVSESYTLFFRCIVDHLNTVSREVSLHVHYLEVSHRK